MNPSHDKSENSCANDEDCLQFWNVPAANAVAEQPKDSLNDLHASLSSAAYAFLQSQNNNSGMEDDDKTVTSSTSSIQSAGNIPKPKRPRYVGACM